MTLLVLFRAFRKSLKEKTWERIHICWQIQFGKLNWLNFKKPAGGMLHLIPYDLGMSWDPPGSGESLLEKGASGVPDTGVLTLTPHLNT